MREITLQNPDALITINGTPFTPLPSQRYKNDYVRICSDIKRGKIPERDTYRKLCQTDLWFLVYFVLPTPIANHPWWIHACHEVETGPTTDTIDIWARDHGKSTIITIGETIQDILRNPNETIAIYSYTRDLAQVFFGAIKNHFERNEFLKWLFEDIIPSDTGSAEQWTDEGITVIRDNMQKECTLEPWGLTKGQPTGRHFSIRKYDDISTLELSESPSMMRSVISRFDMSENTSKTGGRRRLIGTIYDHNDVLCHAMAQKKPDGSPMWMIRRYPATDDGTATGKPVWLAQEDLDRRKVNRRYFNTQMLCDPTPLDDVKLSYNYIHHVAAEHLPARHLKFMVVDPAGDKQRADGRRSDAWAIWVAAVEPYITNEMASKIYLIDGFVGSLARDVAIKTVVNMYLRHGLIHRLGIEKAGLSSDDLHIKNALRAKGRHISEENKTLHILKHGGRNKQSRIEGALSMPLNSGLIHVVDTVPVEAKERLREEMEQYPFGADDGLDGLAYFYDMLRDFLFPNQEQQGPRPPQKFDIWARFDGPGRREKTAFDWMGV